MRTAAASVLLVVGCLAAPARALEPAPPSHKSSAAAARDSRRFPVNFVNLPDGSSVTLRSGRPGDAGASCSDACTLLVTRGTYELALTEPDALVSTRRFSVVQSENVSVRAPDRDWRAMGLELTVGGLALTGVSGAVALLAVVGSGIPDSLLKTALVGLAGGAVLGGVGLALWLPNDRPGIQVDGFSRLPDHSARLGSSEPWARLGRDRGAARGLMLHLDF